MLRQFSKPTGQANTWAVTPQWRKGSENCTTAKGITEELELLNIPASLTRAETLQGKVGKSQVDLVVTGAADWLVGQGPKSPAQGRQKLVTANNNSFDMSMLWAAEQQMLAAYETAGLGNSIRQLATSRGKPTVISHANLELGLKTGYNMMSEEIQFTVAQSQDNKSVWDLAADSDAVVHERGHWFLDHLFPLVQGAIHEGYADAMSAFTHGNPLISEDYGKLTRDPSGAMRVVENDLTVPDTSDEVHDRGRVYGGVFWEMGQAIHQQLTGRIHNPAVESLDPRARELALRILWTFPLFMGTRLPGGRDMLDSLSQALDSLKTANKIPGVDTDALKKTLHRELVRRQLMKETETPPAWFTAENTENAVRAALEKSGMTKFVGKIGPMAESLKAPSGETITRYELFIPTVVKGREVLAFLGAECITVIKSNNGTCRTQLGALPQLAQALEKVASENGGVIPGGEDSQNLQEEPKRPATHARHLSLLGGTEIDRLSPKASASNVLSRRAVTNAKDQANRVADETGISEALRAFAADDLNTLVSLGDPSARPLVPVSAIVLSEAADAARAKTTLANDEPSASFVFRNGQFMATLTVGNYIYYSPIGADGEIDLSRTERASAILSRLPQKTFV